MRRRYEAFFAWPPQGWDGLTEEPGRPPLVLCVARHVKVKNLGLPLEACSLLREREVAFKCVSIGDGIGRGELERRHAELQLGDLAQADER